MRLLFLVSFFILSCSNEASVPKGILQPKKMEAVLYDVILADELVDFSSIRDSTFRPFAKRAALYDSVFSLHSTSKDGFKKSLQFYQGRPDLLKTILDSLQKKADTAAAVKVINVAPIRSDDTTTTRSNDTADTLKKDTVINRSILRRRKKI